jgi:hypothetical protein
MSKDVFKENYTAIFVSVKFLGLYWEFWSERPVIGDDHAEFFRTTRDRYRKKWPNREFKMRLYYKNLHYLVDSNTVKPV